MTEEPKVVRDVKRRKKVHRIQKDKLLKGSGTIQEVGKKFKK